MTLAKALLRAAGQTVDRTIAVLHGDGANNSTTITDSSVLGTTWNVLGGAKLSTAQSKFGSASMSFDGTSGTGIYPTAAASTFAFGAGDFTIEMWAWNTNSAAWSWLYEGRAVSNSAAPSLGINGSYVPVWWVSGSARITGTTNFNTSKNAWHHIAVCRASGSTRLFVDGAQEGSTWSDSTVYIGNANKPRLGCDYSATPTSNWNGYIDDVRITKGLARYTSNFTPPGSALPDR